MLSASWGGSATIDTKASAKIILHMNETYPYTDTLIKFPYTNTFFQFEEIKDQYNNHLSTFIARNKNKPTFDCLVSLINDLPDENFSIHFFDYYHPQWSDPGAYIEATKHCSKIYYQKGNHGWTSDWYLSNSKRITAYILKNWEHNQFGFRLGCSALYCNMPDVRSGVRKIEKTEKIWETALTHIGNKVFELNGEVIIEHKNIKYHTDIFNFDNLDFIKKIDFLRLEKIDVI